MSKTKAEYIEEMFEQLVIVDNCNEILKGVKAEAKKDGFDPALLATIAKSQVNANTAELAEKSQAVIDLIEELK